MVDFVRLAATAQRLIEANGRSFDLLKSNRDPASASEPWRGPDLSAEPAAGEGGDAQTVTGAFVPLGSGLGLIATDGDEALVRQIEQVVLVASTSLADGTALETYDLVRDDSKVWKIVVVQELRPASQSLMYAVGLATA